MTILGREKLDKKVRSRILELYEKQKLNEEDPVLGIRNQICNELIYESIKTKVLKRYYWKRYLWQSVVGFFKKNSFRRKFLIKALEEQMPKLSK